MAIKTPSTTVGTTATLLSASRRGGTPTVVIAPQGGTVFVGGSDVTTSTGIPVPVGAVFCLSTREAVYGIAASASTAVRVLQTDVP